MLGEIVIDDQGVAARLHDLLAHRRAGIWSEILQRGRLGGRGGDDNRVAHRAVALERRHDLGDLTLALADSHVDADDAGILLIDDRIDRHRRLAGLAVADDQLALATADRDHCVDRLDAGLQRRVHVLARDDTGSDALHRTECLGLDRPLAVDRLAQRVDNASYQRTADGNLGDTASRANLVALLNACVLAEDDDADRILLQVERHANDALLGELDQLVGHHVAQAMDGRDTVTDLDDVADVGHRHPGFE